MASVNANLWDVATTDDRFRLSREDVYNSRKLSVIVKKAAFRLRKQGAKVIGGNKITLVADCTDDVVCMLSKIGKAFENSDMPLSKQEALSVISVALFVNTFRSSGIKIPILLGRMTTIRSICKRLGAEK